jgi:carboxylate-amine ligase
MVTGGRPGTAGRAAVSVDARTGRILPVRVQADALVDHIRPALDEHGDTDLATAFLGRLAAR